MKDLLNKLLVITGPTASGKSRLSMDLAEHYPIEVVSTDSMQIYRYMDIGTDKPSAEDRQRVPHHLIDIKYPDEPWSVEEFQRLAQDAISDIHSRGRLPCVVGGTGLYVRALLQGYPLKDAPPDWTFRVKMRELALRMGNQAVHALLKDVDPEAYSSLHPNDLKRVIRALEYYRATGRPISERKLSSSPPPYDVLMLGILWERNELYERIDTRVEEQFRRGFVDEVRNLLDMGYSEELRSMQGLGYKEICYYLRGLTTLDETKELIKRNTRRFAKRQFTWFSREKGIVWIEAGKDKPWSQTLEEARNVIESWLSRKGRAEQ